MRHGKTNGGDGASPKPAPSWLAGAAIGLTILGMASSAMVLGAGLAWSQTSRPMQ
ncbi:MAG TPA: hypothetical protein VND19_22795 [Acetobacteraceae bacterium]|nr:hypothetical protein [Acetobacteraceae bacterium]